MTTISHTQFNPDAVEKLISTFSDEISDLKSKYKTLLYNHELAFAEKIVSMDKNIKLFKKVNLVVSQIKRATEIIDSWHENVKTKIYEVSALLYDYSTLELLEKVRESQASTIGGPSYYTDWLLNKKKLASIKAKNQYFIKTSRLERKIRVNITQLHFQQMLWNKGVIRKSKPTRKYKRQRKSETVCLKNVLKSISDLTESDSPLIRAQTDLSNYIKTNLKMT